MAAPQQAPPTFKLVLVGDGGTGKVSCPDPCRLFHRITMSSHDGGRRLNCETPHWLDATGFPSVWTETQIHHPALLEFFFAQEGIANIRFSITTDHLRQAPLDWRVRKEVHRHLGC